MTRREFLETSTTATAVLLQEVSPTIAGEPQGINRGQWDAEGQRRRRQEIYELHQRSVGPLFDGHGNWISKTYSPPSGRELLWNALSFLKGATTRQKGNALVRRLLAQEAHEEGVDHFINVAAVQVLVHNAGELEADLRKELRTFLYRKLTQTAGSPIRYLGYNDNFQAMETMFAIVGGEILNHEPSQRRGLEGLEAALQLLERRGLLSEYTSPTYSPVSLLCFAEIAELARDRGAVSLALRIEHRVWIDLATHFHEPTNVLAGPHSRAYAVDSAGQLHLTQMTLYQVFGNKLWMTPRRFLFPPIPGQVVHHDGNVPFMQVSDVWQATGTYHPDREIERLMFAKPFPFRVTATAEQGSASVPIEIRGPEPNSPFHPSSELFEYPSVEVLSKNYMTEDFAIGTATAQFHNGDQTDTFFVNFRRAKTPASLADISTIFCRYTSDDHRPGSPEGNPVRPQFGRSADLLIDEGRVRTVQKDSTALVLYQAKGQILDNYRSLRLTIVVPVMFRPLRAVWCGHQYVSALPFASAQPQTIWLEDDFLLASFRPLVATDHGRSAAVRIEEVNGYLTISFYNYEGPPKRFTRKELLLTRNGFVAELGAKPQESLAAFRKRLAGAILRDDIAAVDQRTVAYQQRGAQLSLSHSMYYDGLKFAAIDGKQQPRPKLDYTRT